MPRKRCVRSAVTTFGVATAATIRMTAITTSSSTRENPPADNFEFLPDFIMPLLRKFAAQTAAAFQ